MREVLAFIDANKGWLWRLPVNAFTVWVLTPPSWMKFICFFILACDLVRLGMEIQSFPKKQDQIKAVGTKHRRTL